MKYLNKNIYFFVITFLTITNFNAQNLASLIEKYNENKNDEAIILEIGKKYADKKNWEKSIEYFQKLVDINPNNPEYLYRLGGTQAAYSQDISKLRVLNLINKAKSNLIKSANLDKKNINSRWVLVQIFSELPSIVGGDLKKASIYTDEIFRISKIHGLLSKHYLFGIKKDLKKQSELEKQIFTYAKKNKPKFKFNYFNFKMGSILMNNFNEYELAKSYFNQYLNKLSSADRISKSVIYYNLANCSYFTKDNKSEYYLNKSIKYLRKSDKDYYDLKSKIDLLSKNLKN